MAQADAQYVIDIAAQMDGGEKTVAELDSLTATMLGAGKNAEFFQQAVKRVSADLTAASAASAAANAALAAGNDEYATLERAAVQASKAVERLGMSGDLMSREYLDAAKKAHDASVAVNAHAGTLQKLEDEAKQAASAEDGFARSLNNVRKLSGHVDKTLERQAQSLSKLGGALGAIGGPLGSVGQKLTAPIRGFHELSQVMTATQAASILAAVGVAAVGVAILAVAAAAVFGIGKITMWAVRLADKEGKLAAQTEKLEDNFNDLFSGLNIEPVIAGMEILANLFDENTEAGKAMKFLFEAVFQPLIDQAENAAVAIEAFALGFLIGLTKVYIAVKPALRAIGELFGFEDDELTGLLESLTSAGEIAAYIFVGLAAAFGLVVGAVVAVIAVFGAMVASIIMIPVVLGEAAAALLNLFVGAVRSVIDYFGSISWSDLGKSIIDGIVNGITGAAGGVVNAITGAVGGAISAAKSMLGIASPSKVFENFGDMTGEGFVSGVEAQNDNAQAAMTDMVEPTLPAQPFAGVTSASTGGPGAAPEAATAAGGAGGESGGMIINLQGAQLSFTGLKDAPQGVQEFAEMLTKIMKGDAASLGKSAEESAAA